jgi:hypothetical protein
MVSWLRYLILVVLPFTGGGGAVAMGSSPVPTASATSVEQVSELNTSLQLTAANVLEVDQAVVYDFGSNSPHPVTLRWPLVYHDDQGQRYPQSFSLQSAAVGEQTLNLHPDISNDAVSLVLPAADPLGKYRLKYRISPLAIRTPAADVIKYAIVGIGWPVAIARAVTTIATAGPAIDNPSCLAGPSGANNGSCSLVSTSPTAITLTTTRALMPGDGLTFTASLPPGSFQAYLAPSEIPQSTAQTRVPIWPVGLIGVLVIVGSGWLIYYRRRTRPNPPPPPR